ncbi:pentatricopeptide repeat-containing protein At2g15820, chloroplastic [Cynara cardunculus var. scolymus]|uniref:LAGLIDADG DNA endonuclease n=1 Tax=Cynara cardunculus var. scolymus TaxID=59895 RepID=A0A103XM29_CYNCS|nr:pentatricopeptide repeat-containing protein At2g15820, chloroplastic [Cynara cardunculus var. scolymus]KVH93256.1 LAGLIDADG DNA endonuclease [Cynara cardunculus var. scolymus]
MPTSLSILRSLSTYLPNHRHPRLLICTTCSLLNKNQPPNPPRISLFHTRSPDLSSVNNFVDQLACEDENLDFDKETKVFTFDASFGTSSVDSKNLNVSPSLDVKELDELPEQWRRSKLAWLCKELPSHNPATVIRILNAQRKWVNQEDMTYLAVHCMRIRENETGFRVYKWMMQQHWFRFDFSLATKLADYMGKERKYLKCRDIFDDIINHGLVPTEYTFHILIVSYLSSSNRGCLDEACAIYNRMIQLGGYSPRLSLHNSLFKALLSKPNDSPKQYVNQAEFIFHQMVTSGFKIHKDIYGGLIWLHSHQDKIDMERIVSLRSEMQLAGFEESKEVLVSVLRACSKDGDIEEAEKTWTKLVSSTDTIPSLAFVYKMEVYARIGEHMRSLEVFRGMQEHSGSASTVAFHKIIEVLCKAHTTELAESLMKEFIGSGKKALMPSFINLMEMYLTLGMHDKLEYYFFQSFEKCRPNRTIYNIYLKSLVHSGSLDKAEEILRQMQSDETVGVDTKSCNTILRGYLDGRENVKAEQIYGLMREKKFQIEPALMEKLEKVLRANEEAVKNPIILKLSKEQREALVGLLLGGLQIESDEQGKNHKLVFKFNEDSGVHKVLKRHIRNQYHKWLDSSKKQDGNEDKSCQFTTISHSYFGFYADQFWPQGQPVIPKLIHRWLSPRVLAYWYMYGGYRTSSGDILLKLRGSEDGVDRIVKTLGKKSLSCKVKRKGRFFWIGLLGSNSTWFWKLVDPYIVGDLKDLLKPENISSDLKEEARTINFDRSDSDYSEDDIT